MKPNLTFFSVAWLLLLSSCLAQERATPTLRMVQETNSPWVFNPKQLRGGFMDDRVNPNTGKLGIYSYFDTLLYFYDWNSKRLVDSARADLAGREKQSYIRNFTYHDDDSIFFIVQPHFRNNWRIDSLIVQVDAKGRLRRFLSTHDLPFSSREFANLGKDSLIYLASHNYGSMYSGGFLHLSIKRQECKLGDSTFNAYRTPLAACIDATGQGRGNHMPPLFFPEYAYVNYYPRIHHEVAIAVNHRGNPVYALGLAPEYYEYDLKTREMRSFRVPSRFVDTIPPLYAKRADGNLNKDLKSEPNEAEYGPLYFDPYRKLYYRVIKLGIRPGSSIREQNSRTLALAVLDTSFRLLGEGLLPPELQPEEKYWINLRLLIAPDGLYCLDRNRSKADPLERNHFYRYRFEYGPPVVTEATKQKSKGRTQEDWQAYAELMLGRKMKTEAVLIVPVDNSCPNCLMGLLTSYPLFAETQYVYDSLKLSYPPTPMVLTARQAKMIDQKIAETDLDTLKYPIRTDRTDAKIDYVLKDFVNPRLLFFRKGKLYRRYDLNPAEMQVMPYLLTDFYKGKELPKPEDL